MPAYNFKARFADDVESGQKRLTIRRRRKYPTHVGDMLFLYTGQRTKACRKLGEHVCKGLIPIDIYSCGVKVGEPWLDDNLWLAPAALEKLAHADGFATCEEFLAFFDDIYGLPLIGKMEIIEW